MQLRVLDKLGRGEYNSMVGYGLVAQLGVRPGQL